jgi:aspartate 1-decarboxylase
MKHIMVRAKIHRATVTDGNKNYPGSITIGKNMLDDSGILPFELIHINNVDNGNHWETYVIPGKDREIILNGGPSHHFRKGDIVVIMAMAEISEVEVPDFVQRVVYVDSNNFVISTEDKRLRDLL